MYQEVESRLSIYVFHMICPRGVNFRYSFPDFIGIKFYYFRRNSIFFTVNNIVNNLFIPDYTNLSLEKIISYTPNIYTVDGVNRPQKHQC